MKRTTSILIAIFWSQFAFVDSVKSENLPQDQQRVETIDLPALQRKLLSTTDLGSRIVNEVLEYFSNNEKKIANKEYISVVNFNKFSGETRFYLITTATGAVQRMHVSHGKNSDYENDGYAKTFSNEEGSLKSSLGFALTTVTYEGNNGYSMRLNGLEEINNNLLGRAVVVHGADYVGPGREIMGRSWGCPALSRSNVTTVINKIKSGSLFFMFHDRIDEYRRNPARLMGPDRND